MTLEWHGMDTMPERGERVLLWRGLSDDDGGFPAIARAVRYMGETVIRYKPDGATGRNSRGTNIPHRCGRGFRDRKGARNDRTDDGRRTGGIDRTYRRDYRNGKRHPPDRRDESGRGLEEPRGDHRTPRMADLEADLPRRTRKVYGVYRTERMTGVSG